jgi:hypothetical protein
VQEILICKDFLKTAFEQKSMYMKIPISLQHLELPFMPDASGKVIVPDFKSRKIRK